MTNKTALITGASAGLGAKFAEQLAARGYNLVICARRKNRLEEIAREIKSKHKVCVEIIPCDLSEAKSPEKIFDYLNQRKIRISYLINNAGYSLADPFSQNSLYKVEDFLQVMMTSLTKLAHLALHHMKEDKFGRIINVGSVAAFVPEDRGSLYTAVKTYVLSFSRALAKEFAGTNIKVLCLCPGFTHTEFHDVLGNKEAVSKFPKIMWMDSETVVKQGLNAIERGNKVYINGTFNKIVSAFFTVTPRAVSDYFMPKRIVENSYKVNN